MIMRRSYREFSNFLQYRVGRQTGLLNFYGFECTVYQTFPVNFESLHPYDFSYMVHSDLSGVGRSLHGLLAGFLLENVFLILYVSTVSFHNVLNRLIFFRSCLLVLGRLQTDLFFSTNKLFEDLNSVKSQVLTDFFFGPGVLFFLHVMVSSHKSSLRGSRKGFSSCR